MEHILEIDPMDDIVSMRNRIEFAFTYSTSATMPLATGELDKKNSNRRRLLLVVPRNNKALQNLVNMKLLARIVHTKSVEMAMVTDQPTVQDYAREVGIKIFGSVQSAKRGGWISSAISTSAEPIQPVETVGNGHLLTVQVPDGTESTAKRVQNKKYKVVSGSGRVGIFQQVGTFILITALAVAVVMGIMMLLPRATVTLIPVAQQVETNLVVKGDPSVKSVDFKTLTFPARIAQIDLSLPGQINTLEAEFAPSGLARGNVTFINRTETVQTFPFSTTLLASSGEQVDFLTLITATIPSRIDATTVVPVIANKPGPIGNVSVGQINRFADSSYNVVARVINEAGFGGGALEMKKVVVQSDKERLQIHLQQKLKEEGLKQLQEALAEQEFISPDTIQVIPLAITYKEFAGDISDTFSGEMQAAVRGTVVGGYNANRLAMAALEVQVPPGFKLDTKGLHFGAGDVLETKNGVVSFRIVAQGLVVPLIDPHQVAADIAWLSIGEAQAMLSEQYRLATVPGVELQPTWLTDWLGRLPFAPIQINVIIKESVTLEN